MRAIPFKPILLNRNTKPERPSSQAALKPDLKPPLA